VYVTDQEATGLKAVTRSKGFAICVQNRGAEDLDVRKVYRVVPDKAATAEGYLRVIDESGEDYLYPAGYFAFVDLPREAKRVWVTRGQGVGGTLGARHMARRRTEVRAARVRR
jgi:hypothetical protein